MMWAARPRLSGVAAGLAVASSVAFAVSIAVMSCAAFLVYLRRKRFWPFIDDFAGPVLAIAFVFLVIPVANGWRATPSVSAVWPAIGLALVIAAHRMPSRIVATPLVAAALGLIAIQASQLRTTHFDGAVGESGMKHLMRRMSDEARNIPTVALHTSAGLEDCARYYILRYRLAGFTVVADDTLANYSIVFGAPDPLNAHVLGRHEFSGTSLVRRTESP
jgi:hypothetical protein